MTEDIGIVILLGGKSSRMGQDKYNLTHHYSDGKKVSFLENLCRELSSFDNKYISVSDRMSLKVPKGYTCVEDLYPDAGPMGGLLSVFLSCNCRALMCVAVDMPNITKEMILSMIRSYKGEDILSAISKHGYEPLFSIYSSALIPDMKKSVEKGCFKMGALRREGISVREIKMEDTDALLNINTDSDYKKWIISKER